MGPVDSGGPFGSGIGKTFAPTSDASTQAKQTDPLAGEQQAVKVLRFDLPNVIPERAPAAAALLAPKAQVGGPATSPNAALFATVMRSILGPQADALSVPAAAALTTPAASPMGAVPGGGNLDENLGLDRSGTGPRVSGAASPLPPVNAPGGDQGASDAWKSIGRTIGTTLSFEHGDTADRGSAEEGPFSGDAPPSPMDWKKDPFGGENT